jgi:Cellulase (glycosyl hydrolase family 5)
MQRSISPKKYGVSFSSKQCAAFGVDEAKCLDWLLTDVGFNRFRLMSYWNEHEKKQGIYTFKRLDEQIDQIEKAGGEITLCLGARQPRWPENHWPNWAWETTKEKRTQALLKYIEKVVKRYKDRDCIVSWQLENEALLRSFGRRPEVNRKRLRDEFTLIKTLDPSRPIIMSTSNNWGIPMRQPIPDIIGFSYYGVVHSNDAYHRTMHRPWIHRLRKFAISYWWNRPVFVHELQCEPWGPAAIWKMSLTEQDNSMDTYQITNNINDARRIGAYPIDLWGAEWWYWRLHVRDDPSIWHAVRDACI